MTVTLRTGDLDTSVHAAEWCLGLFMETFGEEVLDTMQDVAPYDDGDLRDGLKLRETGRFSRLIIGEAEHTEAVLRGTGLYGPKRRVIRPTRAKALRFEIGGEVIFARFVRGQRPQNFAARTLDIEVPRIDRYLEEAATTTKRSYG